MGKVSKEGTLNELSEYVAFCEIMQGMSRETARSDGKGNAYKKSAKKRRSLK